MKSFNWFIEKKLLLKDWTAGRLSPAYLKKARNNLVTMELLSKAPKFKKLLELPEDYDPNEWVVIAAYYAMYVAALSILAKLSYRSKNHSATVIFLEEFLVKKNLLEKEYLETLNKVRLKKEEIETLERARNKREIAQYSVTKETTRQIAEAIKQDAHRFVDRIEELLEELK